MTNDGNTDAMNELGIRYKYGEGIEKDEKKAFELFSSASKKNCIKAKFNLAICYYNGSGTEKNEFISFNIFKELAEKYNHAESYYYLGEFYYWGSGPVEIDFNKSFLYYNEALKIAPNCLRAKFCISYAYYSGKGVNKNYEIAFNFFKELVEEDNFPDAYFYLGEFYYLGRIVQPNYEKAILYFNESIKYKKNIYASKYYLGEIYMLGKGTDVDYQKSKMYFEEILNKNYDDAYYKLALIYTGNYGIEKDDEKVNSYFGKIEFDLCMALIYFLIAIKPEEEQTLDEILKLLNSQMEVVKITLLQFPENHPAKVYHNRLSYLRKEEYDTIVERLYHKIVKCKENKTFGELIKFFTSETDISFFAKCIVESPYYNSIEEYVKDSIKKEDVEALIFVGKLFINGIFVSKDVEKGLNYLYDSKRIAPEKIDTDRDKYIEKFGQ